ncbi:hypothetical protein D9757_004785 [Collybiopsis confluens]|uniref:Pheromone receptor n=1 Tax=Collybiopsis confluens TaxID=2823264 RepID=A0A8H5MBQ7_9AGAR|nr:hypothetical protein D9757_004785 [Collybiopsis confluens]
MGARLNVNIDTLYFGFSFLGFILVLIPFSWHLKAKNTGTCLFMAWIGSACLVFSINSMLWNGTADNFAPIWCGISAKFSVGASTAIPAVSLCINLRLWLTVTDRIKILEKRGMFLLEISLGLLVPLADIGFQYIVQERWFNIYGGFGCRAVSANVLLTYLLLSAPQLVLGIFSMIFCILTLVAYHRMNRTMLGARLSTVFNRRKTLSTLFLLFLFLGGFAAVLGIVYAIFVVYFNARPSTSSDQFEHPFAVWKSWDSIHTNASAVTEFNEAEWRGDVMTELLLEADRWIFVVLAFIFFLFFGFTSEARRRYRMFFGRRELPHECDSSDNDSVIGDTRRSMNQSTSSLHTNFQAKPTLDKSLIGQPRAINLLPVLEGPFKLENPYPVHTYENRTPQAPPTIRVTSSSPPYPNEVAFTRSTFVKPPLPSLFISRPLSAASYVASDALKTGSSASFYSQSSEEPLNPSLLSPPPLGHAGANRLIGMPVLASSSSPASSMTFGGLTVGPGPAHVTRPSNLRVRSRPSSIFFPPTGLLPDPPRGIPSIPSTVGDFF